MNLTDRSRRDTKRYLSDDKTGNAVEITLTAPNKQKAIITGWHTKHHLGVSLDGLIINSRHTYISFHESVLIAANPNYPLRNADGEVSVKNHLIDVKDSTDILKNYIAQAAMPDEKMGVILMTLEFYKA